MYDQDGSGEITPEEMVEIFSLMYAVQVGRFSRQIKLVVAYHPCDKCFGQHNMFNQYPGLHRGRGKSASQEGFCGARHGQGWESRDGGVHHGGNDNDDNSVVNNVKHSSNVHQPPF